MDCQWQILNLNREETLPVFILNDKNSVIWVMQEKLVTQHTNWLPEKQYWSIILQTTSSTILLHESLVQTCGTASCCSFLINHDLSLVNQLMQVNTVWWYPWKICSCIIEHINNPQLLKNIIISDKINHNIC